MPTIPYKNNAGQKVKGTTTLISNNLGWSSRPLQYWYWQKGFDQIEYKDIFKHTGADIGTCAHSLITDYFLVGKIIPASWEGLTEEEYGKAKQALHSFVKWADNCRFEPYATEINMVSEEHQYGLTPDIIGMFRKEALGLVDLKSGNAIYDSHILQMAAYYHGWHELHPDEPLTEGIHVLRIGKENANFTHHWWQELPPEAFEAFLLCKRLEQIHPIIEGMLK